MSLDELGKKTLKISERFGRSRQLKIDVILGNPPYNNGMDLDFVNFGFEIASRYCCFIIPSKWQTASENQRCASKTINYGQLRDKMEPFIDTIVFYPDSFDIFLIALAEGVSYVMIDKEKRDDVQTIKNISSLQRYCNSVSKVRIAEKKTLWNIGNKIINGMGEYKKFDLFRHSYNKELAYKVCMSSKMCVSGNGFRVKEQDSSGKWRLKSDIVGKGGPCFSGQGDTLVIANAKIMSCGEVDSSSSAKEIFYSDNLDECRSFYSYIDSKLIRFIVLVCNSGLSLALSDSTWRYVPAPPSEQQGHPELNWNHIYNDKELYEAFKISPEHIEAIESIVKTRAV